MEIGEKVAYLKGLIEGLEIDKSTKEGKVILAIADVLAEVAVTVEDMQDQIDEVVEVVDTIDEDLGDVEKIVYDLDNDDYCDDDCCCDDDEDEYEVVCPSCGDTICLNEGMIAEGSMTCPGCGELLEFDFEDEDGAEE